MRSSGASLATRRKSRLSSGERGDATSPFALPFRARTPASSRTTASCLTGPCQLTHFVAGSSRLDGHRNPRRHWRLKARGWKPCTCSTTSRSWRPRCRRKVTLTTSPRGRPLAPSTPAARISGD
jgi:hypothetical protein